MAMTAPRPASRRAAGKRSLYVYGVTWADAAHPRSAAGVAGGDVSVVEHGELAAIVSAVSEVPVRAKRRDLLRHMEVLAEVFASTPVLPFQFGNVFPNRAVLVEELLSERYEELVGLLHDLDGLAEVRIRATYDRAEILAEIVHRDPRIARLREATRACRHEADPRRVQLGEAVARSLAALRERDVRAISAALAVHARDSLVEEPRTEYELMRSSFLVDRRNMRSFDRAMDELARTHRGRIGFTYIGPLPPHSFVSLSPRRR